MMMLSTVFGVHASVIVAGILAVFAQATLKECRA